MLPNPEAQVKAVSAIHVESVRAYIRGQAEHHRREDLQTESRRYGAKNGMPVDERYVWE